MTLKELYTEIDGNYDEVVKRLMNETLVRKFVLKFLDDKSLENLRVSLDGKNYPEAFRAAHTIKGVCQNLSFGRLYHSSSILADALRDGNWSDEYSALVSKVEEDYEITAGAIRKFQESGN